MYPLALDAQVAALSTYCERHSAPEPPHLVALRLETAAVYRQAARMLSGPLQGRILTLLASIKGEGMNQWAPSAPSYLTSQTPSI